jgi:hypothetical protein
MVMIVNRRTAVESFGMRAVTWAALAGMTLALGACSSDGTDAVATGTAGAESTAPAPEQQTAAAPEGGLVFGGAGPGAKFAPPKTARGTPDLNTVPTQAPTPPSTKEERTKTLEGLIADRANARYSDQGGRTLPVAVRPLSESPDAARTDVAARIDAPAPARPAEADAQPEVIFPERQAAKAEIGPRTPGAAPARAPIAGNESAVAAGGGVTPTLPDGGGGGLSGFRSLAEYNSPSDVKATLAGTLTLTGGNLTASDRNILNTAARQNITDRSTVRIIGHGTGGLDRAVVAAKELQRLGVPRDRMFVGSDNQSGPTEVYLDRGK